MPMVAENVDEQLASHGWGEIDCAGTLVLANHAILTSSPKT
jgi:hypothetical protein